MKQRAIVLLSSLVLSICLLLIPMQSVSAQINHTSHATRPFSTTAWCWSDIGQPGSNYSCDGHFFYEDLGGNLSCAASGHYAQEQVDTVYKGTHLEGYLHLYTSYSNWCFANWAAFNNTSGHTVDITGMYIGDHNSTDENGQDNSSPANNSWSNSVMDEATTYCISAWVYGLDGGQFQHKLIFGGAGC